MKAYSIVEEMKKIVKEMKEKEITKDTHVYPSFDYVKYIGDMVTSHGDLLVKLAESQEKYSSRMEFLTIIILVFTIINNLPLLTKFISYPN